MIKKYGLRKKGTKQPDYFYVTLQDARAGLGRHGGSYEICKLSQNKMNAGNQVRNSYVKYTK